MSAGIYGMTFTIADICAATGKPDHEIIRRIRKRVEAGIMQGKPKGKKGQPNRWTYIEVTTILAPMRPVLGTYTEEEDDDEARVDLLRRQLMTDGFQVKTK